MRYWEDFSVGEEQAFGRYDVTREEIVEFAEKYDPQPFHLSDEGAQGTMFERLCASGWHTCAMAMRMLVDHMHEAGGGTMGSPGIDEIRWMRPVRPGDSLSMRSKVLALRKSKSRPNVGIVRTEYTVLNQDGDPVMRYTGAGFLPRRGKA